MYGTTLFHPLQSIYETKQTGLRIRIRINVNSWIRIQIHKKVESLIRFRIRLKVKSWTRIRIKVMRIRKPKNRHQE
jgi:hypothetical protein